MSDDGSAAPEGHITWVVWPVVRDPLKAFGIGLLVVGFSAYCLFTFDHWLYAASAFVILLLGSHSVVLPSTYTIDADGIRLKHLLATRSIPWHALACYLRAEDFIALSVASPPTHRSISEGMIVRLAGNGDDVEAAIAAYIPACPRRDDGEGSA